MYKAHCVKCKSPFTVPLGKLISAVCPMCELINTPLKPPAKRNANNNSERDEIAKEIFKILTIDLVKSAMESPKTANAFRTIMEANCKTAFMHADLFMEQRINVQTNQNRIN